MSRYSLLILLVGLLARPAWAGDAAKFDVPPLAACRDITTPDFQWHYPGQRLWETKINVSLLSRQVDEGRISQILVRIDNPRRVLRVVDYAPRTTLTTDVQGTLRRDHHSESTRNLDFAVRGGLPGFSGEASGSARSRQTTDEQVERLPALSLLVASGTMQRGSGVYFKLKPSTRSTLEGSHEFTLWLAAPENWCGDFLRVRCEAFARESTLVPSLDESVPWGDQDFALALYCTGDEAGRKAADAFVRAEGTLRYVVMQNRRALAQRRDGDVVKEIATLWSGRDARLPSGWFEQLIYGPLESANVTILRLPEVVRPAAERYVAARKQLTTRRTGDSVAKIERLPPVK